MSNSDLNPKNNNKLSIFNWTLVIFTGQVGCVTFLIILAATFAGLWLDRQFGSGRAFTFGLLLGSIPVSLIVTIFLARSVISKIRTKSSDSDQNNQKE